MNDPIFIWKYEDAPKKYKKLSPHGGDEDWVAFIPKRLLDADIPFLEEGTSFGCCSVSEHEIPEGLIKIGAHA